MTSEQATALPFASVDDWRWRWLQVAEGRSTRLHRIAAVQEKETYEWVGVVGRTVCGLEGRFIMPGLFSRMDALRCRDCCKAVGIKQGRGAPHVGYLGVKPTVPRPNPSLQEVMQERPGWWMRRSEIECYHTDEILKDAKEFNLSHPAHWLIEPGTNVHGDPVSEEWGGWLEAGDWDEEWYWCGNGPDPLDPWTGKARSFNPVQRLIDAAPPTSDVWLVWRDRGYD